MRAENGQGGGDFVAVIGGKYGTPPPRSQGGPDYARPVNTNHESFRTMMNDASNRMPSGAKPLGGTSVRTRRSRLPLRPRPE